MIPQTSYHLKQLGGGVVEQTNLDALKKKKKRERSVLCWEKLVGSFPGKVSNKLGHSGTFLIPH